MSFYRGRNHEIPALNTASLPDQIGRASCRERVFRAV